jgi:hypothetical protein
MSAFHRSPRTPHPDPRRQQDDRDQQRIPFDVANFEMRWEGLPESLVHESLRLLMAHLRF